MKSSPWRMTIAFGLAAALTGGALAGDWPQWGRTPAKNMADPDAQGAPSDFNPGEVDNSNGKVKLDTAKGLKWVNKLGSQSYGNPTVSGGKVFIGTNNDGRGDARFKGDYSVLRAIDEKTGKTLWELTVPKLGSGKVGDWEYLGICSSPAVDGNRVYIVTNRCEVVALDTEGLANGNDGPFQDEGQYMAGMGSPKPPVEVKKTDADIIWRFDMREVLGVYPHNITSSSILVQGDYVYASTSNGVTYDHTSIPFPKAPALICLNRKAAEAGFSDPEEILAGEEASGLSSRILHGNWTSPAYGEVNGKGLIAYGGPDGVLYAFDPKPVKDADGFGILKEVWKHDCNPITYRFKDGDKSKPIRYTRPDGPSEIIATPVIYKNRVYIGIGQDPEHGEGDGNFSCVDLATGKKIWEVRKINRSISTVAIYNDLVFTADFSGFIYCLDANTGELHWKHDTLSHIWASPLVVDGKMYLGNEDGDLTILSATKEKKLINTITFPDSIYSSPIFANGVLYVGTHTQLYAFEGKK